MGDRRIPRGTDNNGLVLADLAVGTRLGEFVIEGSLGARGAGHLYQATHLVLPRRATIKVLPAPAGIARTVVLDLIREACIVDAVDHPGMPRVFECGMLADRRPWIATELIEGVTVEHVLDTRRVSITTAITIVRDVADILAVSHRRGLVHCSVAPSAIVLPSQPRRFPLCLVDWVAARAHDSTAPLPLVVGGRYVAPEQANALAVTDRSDVYSLGRIARDLLDCVAGDDTSPMFTALLHSMVANDPNLRPTSREVHTTAAWLAAELGQHPIRESTSETAATTSSLPITSELAQMVAGEIAASKPAAGSSR